MKKIFLTLLLFSIYGYTRALSRDIRDIMDNYNFSYYTIRNGLPDNFIDDIYKDSQGFLWLATPNGLSRYDGYEFIYYNIYSEAVRLKSNFIRNVCEDDFYRLWIASEGGVDILNLRTNKIVDLIESKEIVTQESSHIIKDRNGNIWIVSQEDIHKISFAPTGDVSAIRSLNAEQKKRVILLWLSEK
ncbi:MAG: hypothetical protein LUD15_08735 [Bacteroides sp.]|nr:hypothetical protein [Bacteroides sp.]